MNRPARLARFRPFAGLAALAAFAALALPSGAQTAAEEPSVEAMLAEARRVVATKRREIVDRVQQGLVVFRQRDVLVLQDQLAKERAALLALGPGGMSALLEAFAVEKIDRACHQIGIVLVEGVLAGQIASETVVSSMLGALSAEEGRSETAAAVLGRLGAKDAVPALRNCLTDLTRKRVVAQALESLARLGDVESFPRMEEALASETAGIRAAGVTAIGLLGRANDCRLVVPMLEDRDESVAVAAVRALEGLKESSVAMKSLHDLLANPNRTLVREAIEAIGRIGNKSSASALKKVVASNEYSYELQKLAAMAQFKMNDRSGLDMLSGAYEQAINRNSKNATAYADFANFLAEFGDWKEAARRYEDAVEKETGSAILRSDYLMRLARAQARLGRFPKAAKSLEAAGLGQNWKSLRDDPAFAEMRKLKAYEASFDR